MVTGRSGEGLEPGEVPLGEDWQEGGSTGVSFGGCCEQMSEQGGGSHVSFLGLCRPMVARCPRWRGGVMTGCGVGDAAGMG